MQIIEEMPSHNLWAERETIQDDASTSTPFIYDETPAAWESFTIKPRNVILFGETGAGKSSIINLMAGRDVAETSPDTEGCTLDSKEYAFFVSGSDMSLRIFDTVGLEEPDMGINTFFGAIEKAQQLITTLHDRGGIDLLLFCVRGGRITNTMQRNYRLFFEFLCDQQVPLAIVVSHLENQEPMESWWTKNEKNFEKYEISSVAHACITSLPAHVTLYATKRAQSRDALRELFRNALPADAPRSSYSQGGLWAWITNFFSKLWSLFTNKTAMKKKEMMQKLATRCRFPPDEAQRLAEIITGTKRST